MLREGKTAEERFHMLARGWLAYPVTLVHAQLPPKSGCREMLREGTTASPGWLRFRRLNFPEIADAKFLAKIFSLIYTTALRR